MPPSLHIPVPVRDLTASRAGGRVRLKWTMPKRTTDRALLKGSQRVEICRLAERGTGAAAGAKNPDKKQTQCEAAANVMLLPGVHANYVDRLPLALETGAPRLLTYAVRVYGPYKRVAGYSNRATVVAGAAPPAVGTVTAETRADGIVLRWHPRAAGPGLEMRMVRTLVGSRQVRKGGAKAQEASPMMGARPAGRQVLEVSLAHRDAGEALDRDATLDHVYMYDLQRVVRRKVDGATADLAGPRSPVVTVDAKDVFPPSVPQNLAAVADSQAGAIDLSWAPSPEADTAGYIVYRRRTGGAWQRISRGKTLGKKPGTGLVVAPAWSDTSAQPGVAYKYSVSAVDRDGNQSARSASVKEELPQKP